jgi:hypothetical protein
VLATRGLTSASVPCAKRESKLRGSKVLRRASKIEGENLVYNDKLTAPKWALNSAVECHPHTVEVVGSNPTAPTILAL